MKRFKRLFILGGLLCLPAILFSVYTNFLLDYSLDNLELALKVTHQNPEEISTLGRKVYHSVVTDLILEEAFAETVNYRNLTLLELTVRSFNEALDKEGYKHAQFYLNEVVRNKLPSRPMLLRVLDFLYFRFLDFYRSLSSLFQALRPRKAAQESKPQQTFEYSGSLLLVQAQMNEEEKDLDKALDLYREYLKFYPRSTDSGFVQISISQILIRQRRLSEAETLLRNVKDKFRGQSESEVARRFLWKIDILRQRQDLIRELEGLLRDPAKDKSTESEFLKLKLAVSYFSLYEFRQAEELFKALTKSSEIKIRQKAQFYLAWIHKLDLNFSESETAILNLLDDPLLEEEMDLGLHAELADIYYKKRELPKSLAQYDEISKKARRQALDRKAIYEAWATLSELEQAKIYFYDFANEEQFKEHLSRVQEFSPGFSLGSYFESWAKTSPNVNLRDRAFSLLFQKRVTLALELFLKHLERYPNDAWAHSGIATAYVLLGDLDTARRFAKKGYRLNEDEYTASVLAYLSSLRQRPKQALILYSQAAQWAPAYLIAHFNLGCIYLTLQQYKKALEVFEKINKSMPMNNYMQAKVINNIGYAHWGLGQPDRAIEKFKEAIALSSKFQTAKENLEQLSLKAV